MRDECLVMTTRLILLLQAFYLLRETEDLTISSFTSELDVIQISPWLLILLQRLLNYENHTLKDYGVVLSQVQLQHTTIVDLVLVEIFTFQVQDGVLLRHSLMKSSHLSSTHTPLSLGQTIQADSTTLMQ